MNILLVSQNFTQGGLETRVDTFYKVLKKKNNLYFAFSNYKKLNYLEGAVVYHDFNFSENSTIKEFISDIEKLITIIKENKIDIICSEPFYSLFPAMFAAHLCNIPITYTIHGRLSINFPNNINDSLLLPFGIENLINNIFTVSRDYDSWLKKYNMKNNIIFSPNIVNENEFKKIIAKNNKKWAMITRLDYLKENEILKVIDLVGKNVLNSVDIYGDGDLLTKINNYVLDLNLEDKVIFKGYSSNLYTELNNKYCGIIATGRSAIEGLTMDMPVLFVGYGKIIGLIDLNLYEKLKDYNFVASNIMSYDINYIKKQIKNIESGEYNLRETIIKDFGISKINEFNDTLKTTTSTQNIVIEKMYNELSQIKKQNQQFYSSDDVFEILSKYIAGDTLNFELKQIINNHNSIRNIYNKFYKERLITNNDLQIAFEKRDQEIAEFKKQIQKQEEEINILSNTFISKFKLLTGKTKNKIKKKIKSVIDDKNY